MPSYVRNNAYGDYATNPPHQQPPPQQQYDQQPNSYANNSQSQQHQYQRMEDQYQQPPKLGATFYPGGQDDFYMPEVVSPLPQRIMPDGKIEADMQNGLANLELEARNAPINRMSSVSSVSTMHSPTQPNFPRDSSYSIAPQRHNGPGFTASYNHTNAQSYQNLREEFTQQQVARNMPDSPKFSPFPKLGNPGHNVPLSDDDKEDVLERARPLVLKSNDPEMQLAWAQDALSWVEVASNQAIREQDGGQPARSITPKVEHQLRTDAISIVQFLAEQHHPKAEFMKGMWLEFGKFGYRIDKKEAFLGYRRAAEKGYARAEYRIGMQYESSNNNVKAIEHYQKGVALKDSASNYRLGMMTLLGQHGMRQDYQKGVDLIRFAADTADENAPQGAYVYGMLLARELPNIVIPEQYLLFDLNDAKLFIEKAAYLGFAKAQLKMAQAYELCQLDCQFEPALSLHYNALAARQGEAEADMAISKWFLCGYEGLFEKNEELAFTYARRAAGTKMATAEFAMGYFYEIGMYVKQDLRESERWYQMASEHGNKDALGRIDSIRKNNTLSRKDHEQVAINRIKSQYGSQRGGRPDRFKQKPPPMPSMAEDRLDMPDPRKTYSSTPQPQIQIRPAVNAPLPPQINNPPPPRPVSVAPYPEDDMPPRFSQKPKPAAPYPVEGGLRPNPRPGPQADRPSSAFGIRPIAHANTDSYGHPNRMADPMRPSTSMGNMNVPAGRGHIPGGINGVQPGGWESQVPSKYREPGPGPGPGPRPIRQPTFPQVESGRNPNFDHQLGPIKLQKVAPLNINKPQPPHPSNQGYPSGPGQRPSSSGGPAPAPRPSSSHGPADPAVKRRDPVANQFSRPERGSSMAHAPSPINPRPDRVDSAQSHAPNPSRASQRPPAAQTPTHTMSSQSQRSRPQSSGSSAPPSVAPSTAPSTAPSAGSAASAGPKTGKTGPSTFEEMGIPAGKNESDCVVM